MLVGYIYSVGNRSRTSDPLFDWIDQQIQQYCQEHPEHRAQFFEVTSNLNPVRPRNITLSNLTYLFKALQKNSNISMEINPILERLQKEMEKHLYPINLKVLDLLSENHH